MNTQVIKNQLTIKYRGYEMRKINRKNMPPTLENAKGTMIPIEMVKEHHLKRHIAVTKIFNKADQLQARIIAVKRQVLKEVMKYQEWKVAFLKTGAPEFANLQLSNYNNTVLIQFKTNKLQEFDDTLQYAQATLSEYFQEITEEANQELQLIVTEAFKMDEKGFVNSAKLFGLFQYNITNPKWKKAMELLNESITVTGSKEYLIIKHRPTNRSKWKYLNLNFSSLETDEPLE